MTEENWREVKKEIILHEKRKCGCRTQPECDQKKTDLKVFMEHAYYTKKAMDERWGT